MSSLDWSELPDDVLKLIVRRLDPMSYYRFRATSKEMLNHCRSFPQFPWFVLSEHNDETDAHLFFSVFHRSDCWLRVPGLRGKRCCGSSHGWLITTDNETFDLHLLNPFSGRQIKLPSPKTFPCSYLEELPYLRERFIRKAIITKDPSLTDDYAVVVIFSGYRRLAFFRPQKEGKWIVLRNDRRYSHDNLIYYKEQVYTVNGRGGLFLVEMDTQPKLVRMTPFLRPYAFSCARYLVEWSGELLQVRRPITFDDEPYENSSDTGSDNWYPDITDEVYYQKDIDQNAGDDNDSGDSSSTHGDDSDTSSTDDDDDESDSSPTSHANSPPIYKTGTFKVYKLVQMNNCEYKWEKVKSIGDYMLFLGDNCPIFLSVAGFPEFKRNQVYFADDIADFEHSVEKGCHDLGIFNLEDKTFESFYPNVYHSPVLPPIWVSPNK